MQMWSSLTVVWSSLCLLRLPSAGAAMAYNDGHGCSPMHKRCPSLLQSSKSGISILHGEFRHGPAPLRFQNCCHWRHSLLYRLALKSSSTSDTDGRSGNLQRKNNFDSNALRLHTTMKALAIRSGQEGISSPDETPTVSWTQCEGSIYHPFIESALNEISKRNSISTVPIKKEFTNMLAQDGAAMAENFEFASSKIRSLRIALIRSARSSIQVLNVAGFPREDYDLPIFCADFVSLPNNNIILLDLNQPYKTTIDNKSKERFFDNLMPLANKYLEVLPWGGKLTAESLQFFSPLVLWARVQTEDVSKYVHPAFIDYLTAWLDMVDCAVRETDTAAISMYREAQHRYISWRANKDPGSPLLTRLYGEPLAERFTREFLYRGDTLGTKSFVDYFPEYKRSDGSIFEQRSVIGKAFEKRPWDEEGNFLKDDL